MYLWIKKRLRGLSAILLLFTFAGCLLAAFPSASGFQTGKVAGVDYTCRYAYDIVDGEKIIDKSLCIGRLADGRYFEIDNGIITIGD